MGRAVTRLWFSWREEGSAASLGESMDYEVALTVARALVADGIPETVLVWEQPGDRLLARVHAGEVEEIAQPTTTREPLAKAVAAAPGAMNDNRSADQKRAIRESMRREQELATRRRKAHVPADGYRVSYAVAIDPQGKAVFVERDHELARSRAAAEGLRLYDSVSWRPLLLSA